MSAIRFATGQRWVSNTEADLGLGIVERCEGRQVQVYFPAAEDVRTYAVDNAPISRVSYEIGDAIVMVDGTEFSVTDTGEQDECILYFGLDSDGQEVAVPERELSSFVRFSRPQERMFAGQIDTNSRFALRLDTRQLWTRHMTSLASGLLGPRVQLLPHQLYIADEIARRYQPRVLLADEVGLGKTIESGLIVHHRLHCGMASRVLVVVPENLVHQWLVEMLRRFNLSFTVLDEERCEQLEGSGHNNPFESAQLVIVPVGCLVESPSRAEQAVEAGWDIVVVDEAHHLEIDGPKYAVIEALSVRAHGLLLLTGTPESLGVESHFARLSLLDPDKYASLAAFREEQQTYLPLAGLLERLPEPGGSLDSTFLEDAEPFIGVALASELRANPDELGLELIERVTDSLLDRHGTGRVLFRNTRAAVGGFPHREVELHSLAKPAGYDATPASQSDTLGMLLSPELVLGVGWTDVDPRVSWLIELAGSNRPQKMLVICSAAATARDLEEHLRTRGGMRTSVFHEEMSLLARDRAAAYFTEEEEESAQVMVASEIGSEGRNFQAAQHLVLFDLPLEPDMLEQRIGRLDRIGQRHTISIHVPFYEGAAGEVMARWYHEALGMFERPCPAARVVTNHFAPRIEASLRSPQDTGVIDALLGEARCETERQTALLSDGRDRLLEANSFRTSRAQSMVEAVAAATHELELTDYMERVFDIFGVDQERHSSQAIVLKPSERMLQEQFPALPEDGVTATFSRSQALAREDMLFLTWEHPMVVGAMDLVLSGGIGNTAVSTLRLPGVKPGVLLVEALFALVCPGPARLQLGRFLGEGAVRVLIDANGADLSGALSAKQLGQLVRRVPIGTAQQIVREARAEIGRICGLAEDKAKAKESGLIERATEDAERLYAAELTRLVELSQVNPRIDAGEISFLESQAEQTRSHLGRAQLSLDAVRVAITV